MASSSSRSRSCTDSDYNLTPMRPRADTKPPVPRVLIPVDAVSGHPESPGFRSSAFTKMFPTSTPITPIDKTPPTTAWGTEFGPSDLAHLDTLGYGSSTKTDTSTNLSTTAKSSVAKGSVFKEVGVDVEKKSSDKSAAAKKSAVKEVAVDCGTEQKALTKKSTTKVESTSVGNRPLAKVTPNKDAPTKDAPNKNAPTKDAAKNAARNTGQTTSDATRPTKLTTRHDEHLIHINNGYRNVNGSILFCPPENSRHVSDDRQQFIQVPKENKKKGKTPLVVDNPNFEEPLDPSQPSTSDNTRRNRVIEVQLIKKKSIVKKLTGFLNIKKKKKEKAEKKAKKEAEAAAALAAQNEKPQKPKRNIFEPFMDYDDSSDEEDETLAQMEEERSIDATDSALPTTGILIEYDETPGVNSMEDIQKQLKDHGVILPSTALAQLTKSLSSSSGVLIKLEDSPVTSKKIISIQEGITLDSLEMWNGNAPVVTASDLLFSASDCFIDLENGMTSKDAQNLHTDVDNKQPLIQLSKDMQKIQEDLKNTGLMTQSDTVVHVATNPFLSAPESLIQLDHTEPSKDVQKIQKDLESIDLMTQLNTVVQMSSNPFLTAPEPLVQLDHAQSSKDIQKIQEDLKSIGLMAQSDTVVHMASNPLCSSPEALIKLEDTPPSKEVQKLQEQLQAHGVIAKSDKVLGMAVNGLYSSPLLQLPNTFDFHEAKNIENNLKRNGLMPHSDTVVQMASNALCSSSDVGVLLQKCYENPVTPPSTFPHASTGAFDFSQLESEVFMSQNFAVSNVSHSAFDMPHANSEMKPSSFKRTDGVRIRKVLSFTDRDNTGPFCRRNPHNTSIRNRQAASRVGLCFSDEDISDVVETLAAPEASNNVVKNMDLRELVEAEKRRVLAKHGKAPATTTTTSSGFNSTANGSEGSQSKNILEFIENIKSTNASSATATISKE